MTQESKKLLNRIEQSKLNLTIWTWKKKYYADLLPEEIIGQKPIIARKLTSKAETKKIIKELETEYANDIKLAKKIERMWK